MTGNLAFSQGIQGYRATLAGLWNQCQTMGLPLPQPEPVAPSTMCRARAKVDAGLFRTLHAEVVRHAGKAARMRRWHGHRLFAVDGSKLNLPRKLARAGYAVPHGGYYPQGLLSCLYRLRQRLPVDFDLHSHADERRATLAHLAHLEENDVVVYDRGYFSFAFLRAHLERGLHPVFRLKAGACKAVTTFAVGDAVDAEVEVDGEGLRMRLVKYSVKDYLLGTTLRDSRKYPLAALSDLYHERWSIEEMFKTAKQSLAVERFHARNERGVKQDLFAHFVLIALMRLFTGHGEAGLERLRQEAGGPRQAINFRHVFARVGHALAGLLLLQAEARARILNKLHEGLVTVRAALRSGRAYPRRSRKPIGKWKPEKAAKAFESA